MSREHPPSSSSWRTGLAALLLAAAAAAQSAAVDDEISCRVCHPGAVRGLAAGEHRTLLQSRPESACSSCHGDLSAHAAASASAGGATQRASAAAVLPVAAAACAVCHPGRTLGVAIAAHPLRPRAAGPAAGTPSATATKTLQDLAAAESSSAVKWSGLAEFGYRLVHVAGSRAGYLTDVDLQPGARLRTAELRGDGDGQAPFDLLAIRAHDIGDPRWGIDGRVREQDLGSLALDFRKDRVRYDSRGDWHRVDRSSSSGTADLEVVLDRDLRAFASFAHRDEDGFWLTERIGNRNVSVQSFVTGVASPRQARREDSELGLTGVGERWTWTLAANYRDDHEQDRWSFARPAPANPAFPESEDFTSRGSLRGPGERAQLRGDLDGVAVDLKLRHYDHDRRVVAAGTAEGFDLAQFTTDTDALGGGSARTWLADCALTIAVAEDLELAFDLRWRDHTEDLSLVQTDVTTYPTLATVIQVDTLADQRTAQRLLDGEATLRWAATRELDLGVGYGYLEEHLRVPEVDPTDPRNFRRGTARDRGVLGDVSWRPAKDWTVRGEARSFGQDGVLLHELAPEEARQEALTVGYGAERSRATLFVRHRRNESDVSQHRLDSVACGGTAGVDGRELGIDVGYTFARIDSITQTNFYFDPDPNPVPTYVGFRGDTNTFTAALHVAPSGDVQWQLAADYATTRGDFAVATLDWRADLRWQVAGEHSSIGTEYRQSYYKQDGGFDDWSAQTLFVYWRQVF